MEFHKGKKSIKSLSNLMLNYLIYYQIEYDFYKFNYKILYLRKYGNETFLFTSTLSLAIELIS